ncbi:MAG TPA: AMP-dependent synthetase [Anaerolineae bacterium]|nr:AMP-dependent synthetase [Anaerolineae bacterium]
MLVHHFLQRSAEQFPTKPALVCGDRRLTYAQIEEQTNRVANGLLTLGMQRGERLAVWLPNSVEAVIAIFAILKAGGVFTVINSTTKPTKLTYILNNCAASGLFAPARQREQVIHLLKSVPSLRFAVLCGKGSEHPVSAPTNVVPFPHLLGAFPPAHPSCPSIDVDLACLIYTSGSTGEPKGVMSTHANVVFAASSIIRYLENTPEDIVINVLPLSFDYGLYQLLMAFKFGGTLVLERSFAYPAAVLRRIEQERVTGFPGVPTLFAMLLQMDLTRFNLSSLRYLTNTAAALPVEHIRRLRDAFPWARLYSMYGLTECKRTLYLPPEELDRRPGSVGIPIPGTEVWIEDEAGNRLGPGEVGELVVRGSHVMQGYWGDPGETARRYRPGRYPAERLLYTGDLFRMDEEGFLYFVARKDDIIKSRGEKVAPKEVANVLYRLPGVIEVAVIGVSDELLGQAIKAFIVCADGHNLREQDVRRHCARHLEDFMIPRYVEFRTSLPKTPSGKIQKSALR